MFLSFPRAYAYTWASEYGKGIVVYQIEPLKLLTALREFIARHILYSHSIYAKERKRTNA